MSRVLQSVQSGPTVGPELVRIWIRNWSAVGPQLVRNWSAVVPQLFRSSMVRICSRGGVITGRGAQPPSPPFRLMAQAPTATLIVAHENESTPDLFGDSGDTYASYGQGELSPSPQKRPRVTEVAAAPSKTNPIPISARTTEAAADRVQDSIDGKPARTSLAQAHAKSKVTARRKAKARLQPIATVVATTGKPDKAKARRDLRAAMPVVKRKAGSKAKPKAAANSHDLALPDHLPPAVSRGAEGKSGPTHHAPAESQGAVALMRPHPPAAPQQGAGRGSEPPHRALADSRGAESIVHPSSLVEAAPPTLLPPQLPQPSGFADLERHGLPILPKQALSERFKLTWGTPPRESVLGSGSYGQVRLIMDKTTGALAAMKEFKHDSAEYDVACADLFRLRPHPNILKAFFAISVPGRKSAGAIVYAFFDESLETRWQRQEGIVGEGWAQHCLRQAVAGIRHMHDNRTIHRDLKPANILVRAGESHGCRIVLADFGWAAHVPTTGVFLTPDAMTVPYRAPEVARGEAYALSADMWSIGLVARELLTGVRLWQLPLFASDGPLKLAHRMATQLQLEDNKRTVPRIPDSARDVISRMLTLDPPCRATAEEAFHHPYMVPRPPVRRRFRQKSAPPTQLRKRPMTARTSASTALAASQGGVRTAPSVAQEAHPSGDVTNAIGHTTPGDHKSEDRGKCACKGNCRTKGQHLGSQPPRPCKNSPEPGSSFCTACSCDVPQCTAVRLKSPWCYKHLRALEAQPVLRIVVRQQRTLAAIMPADLVAFLKANPCYPTAALVLAAQLWQPLAVEHFLQQLAADHKHTTQSVTNAMVSTMKHVDCVVRKGRGKDNRDFKTQCATLAEQGALEALGIAALAERLGIARKVPGAIKADTHTIYLGTQRFKITQDSSRVSELMQAHWTWAELPQARSVEELEKASAVLLDDLHQLPGWALLRQSDICSHVHQKLVVLAMQHEAFQELQWDHISPATWSRLSPNVFGHVSPTPIPESMLPQLFPCISPPLASIWAASMHSVFARSSKTSTREQLLQQWLTEASETDFKRAMETARLQAGNATPSPLRIAMVGAAQHPGPSLPTNEPAQSSQALSKGQAKIRPPRKRQG